MREAGCKGGAVKEAVSLLSSGAFKRIARAGAPALYGALEDVFFSPVLEDAVFQRGKGLFGIDGVEGH